MLVFGRHPRTWRRNYLDDKSVKIRDDPQSLPKSVIDDRETARQLATRRICRAQLLEWRGMVVGAVPENSQTDAEWRAK